MCIYTIMLSPEELARHIQDGMERTHMNRRQLMRAAQKHYPVTYNHIREIERGRSRNPSWYVVLALAKVLGFEHKLGFGESESNAYDAGGARSGKGQSNGKLVVPAELIVRATQLIIRETQRRKWKVSDEQLELWAIEAASMFARTGMKTLDMNFIKSFLSEQEA